MPKKKKRMIDTEFIIVVPLGRGREWTGIQEEHTGVFKNTGHVPFTKPSGK